MPVCLRVCMHARTRPRASSPSALSIHKTVVHPSSCLSVIMFHFSPLARTLLGTPQRGNACINTKQMNISTCTCIHLLNMYLWPPHRTRGSVPRILPFPPLSRSSHVLFARPFLFKTAKKQKTFVLYQTLHKERISKVHAAAVHITRQGQSRCSVKESTEYSLV